MDDRDRDDGIQHGIDDNPEGDAEKGAVLGGLGGAAAGAAAGAVTGPVGALAGAAIGGVAGAVGSGLAVGAVDRVDNDDTFTGIGDGSTRDVEDTIDERRVAHDTYDYERASGAGNEVPGIQTGGLNEDGSADSRGVSEKVADAVTGDQYDDKTGKRI